MIAFELWRGEESEARGSLASISAQQAFAIGCVQSLAVIPGVSRSAATILGGLAIGIPRVAIVEFSFLLAVPTMLAATGLDLAKSYALFSLADLAPLAAGFITSFIVALLAISFLLRHIRTNTLVPFVIYRIAVAFAFWLVVAY